MDRVARRIRTRNLLYVVGAVLIIASAILLIMRLIWDVEFGWLSPYVLLPGVIANGIAGVLNLKIRDESVTTEQPRMPSPPPGQDPRASR